MSRRGMDDDEYDDEEGEEEEQVADLDDEEGEEEEEVGRGGRKRRRSGFFDEDAEEDDDDEEEEEDDDDDDEDFDAGGGSRKRQRKKPSASSFFDEEAKVDSDEEEEEEEGEDDFIVDAGADLPEERGGRNVRRDHMLPHGEEDHEDLEAMARRIQQRYAWHQSDYDEEATDVEQQALLPSVRDPKLWMVKCAIGRERETAVCLMQKYIDKGLNCKSGQLLLSIISKTTYMWKQIRRPM